MLSSLFTKKKFWLKIVDFFQSEILINITRKFSLINSGVFCLQLFWLLFLVTDVTQSCPGLQKCLLSFSFARISVYWRRKSSVR